MLTALATAIIFLLMISIHEAGHFITAKLSGITVLEYAIGMGPAIYKRKIGETLYSFRILPIGGYCQMEGEDTKSDDEGAFCNQKLWKRFLVVISGAILNILLGFILFLVLCYNTAPFASNKIASIDQRSYMYEAGVMPGDKIVKINNKKVRFYQDILLYKNEIAASDTINMEVVRDKKRLQFSFPQSKVEGKIIYREDGYTRVTSMNGIEESENLEYPQGALIDENLYNTQQPLNYTAMGFSPMLVERDVKTLIKEAYLNTGFVVRLVYKSLWDMISGRVGIEQISGPVGIVTAVDDAVKSNESILSLLSLAALLTINLGVFNLLPLPALDGGRLFFMVIEFFRGKPVSAEKEGLVHTIGLIILLLFSLIISAKDIFMIFK